MEIERKKLKMKIPGEIPPESELQQLANEALTLVEKHPQRSTQWVAMVLAGAMGRLNINPWYVCLEHSNGEVRLRYSYDREPRIRIVQEVEKEVLS